jgi:hypothetical protein
MIGTTERCTMPPSSFAGSSQLCKHPAEKIKYQVGKIGENKTNSQIATGAAGIPLNSKSEILWIDVP